MTVGRFMILFSVQANAHLANGCQLLLQIKVEDENKQLKNQLQSMTEQLNQSETVQRDFVRLSQSLQVHLNNMNSEKATACYHRHSWANVHLDCKGFKLKLLFLISKLQY